MSDAPAAADRLPREWFARDTITVARDLLGCLLISDSAAGRVTGRIVETEAYLGRDDAASHAALYQTARVAIMSGESGIAYVYRSYGIHAMLNVVAKPPGETGAVLIRAALPLTGTELMAARRGTSVLRLLATGPGRLAQAFGVVLADHGVDLVTSARLWIAAGDAPAAVTATPRIGISRAVDQPWRFHETGSPFVSGPRRRLQPAAASSGS